MAADRAAPLVAVTGSFGVTLVVLGAVTRIAGLLPAGIAMVGIEYGVFLAVGDRTVKLATPLVAAALLLAAELAYSALEPPLVAAPLGIRLWRAGRSLALVVGGAAVSALVLFAAVADLGDSLGLRLVGLSAAVAAVGLLAVLARANA